MTEIKADAAPLTKKNVTVKGGNAVDAAVATAAALTVVEPTSNGLGSDAFALVWIKDDGKLYGMNSSGKAPKNISAEKVLAQVPDGQIRISPSEPIPKCLSLMYRVTISG